MSRTMAIAVLLVLCSTVGVIVTQSIWPALLLLIVGPLAAIAVLTAATWVARRLRI